MAGSGSQGNGLARAFTQAGIAYDQFEAADQIGGSWAHGVYDSTHLISSKRSTQYVEYPMPAHYPTFPSRAQMLSYLNDCVDQFRLREHIEFNTEVVQETGASSPGRRRSSAAGLCHPHRRSFPATSVAEIKELTA